MKLAITGKGGVGKTTVSVLLARELKKLGKHVIAIDADPDANLAGAIGCPDPDSIRPLVELKDLIEERTGVKPGTTGGMFRLNPLVDDIPERYAVDVDGIQVLVAGAVKRGGSGCYCPENALVRALISHLLVERDSALVLDMEAGIEHLSRGTTRSVDHLVAVVEPSRRSAETANRILRLARDLDMPSIVGIGNKVQSDDDRSFLQRAVPEIEFAGFVPYDAAIRESDMVEGTGIQSSPAVTAEMDSIVEFLQRSKDE